MLVRTWNVFHGNAVPPRRRGFLREMVELVAADRPDLVFLQEVPVWALKHLERWSGMQAVGAVAAQPRLWSAELGRWITELHQLAEEAAALRWERVAVEDVPRADEHGHGRSLRSDAGRPR